ncbi:MAG: hypothetical protein CVU38_09680 [Chloroflexi bacterium HGW-Chloroflexi-1]|nr:MAG: hypothetical protein CVU38_09680 [Chloroflexi bacterium HGW-Chloroflexi-1]
MRHRLRVHRHRALIGGLLFLLVWQAAGCASKPTPTPTPTPAPAATAFPSLAAEAPAIAGATPKVTIEAEPTRDRSASTAQAPAPEISLALPTAFHYEVKLRPVGASDASITVITGQYRADAWSQAARVGIDGTAKPGDTLAEESIVVAGASYTRPIGAATWTRWPGVGFDAAYGLTSPFTALRLYSVAEARTAAVLDPAPGAPEATFRIQTVVSAAGVAGLLVAGVAELAPDAESRAALEAQVAPLALQQTITYWVGEDGRIYRAAATLLATDESGQPAAWLEVIWRFWAYDDPGIAIAPPADFRDAPGPLTTSQPLPTAQPPETPGEGNNLIVRVFSSPGVPADNLAVTVYPAGEARQPVDWRSESEARFKLPPGSYDVLVQMDYAQEWLRRIEVTAGEVIVRDVVFDFGTLVISVSQGGVAISVDIVTYPAGDRQNWVDWRSDNPATIRLRAGTYDVEIAYADYTARQTVTGLVVRAGEVVERVVEVGYQVLGIRYWA